MWTFKYIFRTEEEEKELMTGVTRSIWTSPVFSGAVTIMTLNVRILSHTNTHTSKGNGCHTLSSLLSVKLSPPYAAVAAGSVSLRYLSDKNRVTCTKHLWLIPASFHHTLSPFRWVENHNTAFKFPKYGEQCREVNCYFFSPFCLCAL